eukprot:17099-Rhodomonas_salina.1
MRAFSLRVPWASPRGAISLHVGISTWNSSGVRAEGGEERLDAGFDVVRRLHTLVPHTAQLSTERTPTSHSGTTPHTAQYWTQYWPTLRRLHTLVPHIAPLRTALRLDSRTTPYTAQHCPTLIKQARSLLQYCVYIPW